MNLLIFTPTNKSSSIAQSLAKLSQLLIKEHHKVTIVCSELTPSLPKDTCSFGTSIINWHNSLQITTIIRNTDACYYAMSNDYEAHYGSIYWLHSLPGIVSFFDSTLENLLQGWIRRHPKDTLAIDQTWQGNHRACEWIATLADTVITHTPLDEHHPLTSSLGPAQHIALPLTFKNHNNLAISAEQTHELEQFCKILITLINQFMRAKPILQTLDYFQSTINGWSKNYNVLLNKECMDAFQTFDSNRTPYTNTCELKANEERR